jgi:hypothetical protein
MATSSTEPLLANSEKLTSYESNSSNVTTPLKPSPLQDTDDKARKFSGKKSFDAAIKIKDICSEYDYCMILPTQQRSNDDIDLEIEGNSRLEDLDSDLGLLTDDGLKIIENILQLGLEVYTFLGNEKKEIYVLIRASISKLQYFAHVTGYKMLCDRKELEKIARSIVLFFLFRSIKLY